MAIGVGRQPYTEVFHAQPPLFPWLISLPFRPASPIALDSEVIARLFMTLFAVLLCASAAGVASFLGGPRAGMIAALGTAIYQLSRTIAISSAPICQLLRSLAPRRGVRCELRRPPPPF
jgi:hypothetical protein